MNKSSRNLGAVLAVLVLLLLIAGLVFVVVTVYKDPLQAEIASQESSAMESTTQTSETEPDWHFTRHALIRSVFQRR